jgi:hypothetical protein
LYDRCVSSGLKTRISLSNSGYKKSLSRATFLPLSLPRLDAAVALADAVRPSVPQRPLALLPRQSYRLYHRPGPSTRRRYRPCPSSRLTSLRRPPRHRQRSG